MTKLTITGPDGRRVTLNAPDGATEQQIQEKLDAVKANWSNLGQSASSAPRQSPAYEGTDAAVSAGSLGGPVGSIIGMLGSDYGRDLARTAAQGATLGASDEITAAARTQKEAPGALFGPVGSGLAAIQTATGLTPGGDTYDQALQEERAAVERFQEHNPNTALAAELTGAFAVPAGAAGRFVTQAPTVLKSMGRSSAVGAGFGGVSGFGHGEGGAENRLESAGTGALLGAGLGAALPPAIGGAGWAVGKAHEAVSPQIARVKAYLDAVRAARERAAQPRSLSAAAADGGGLPPASPSLAGADAAADQILANQLSRAGKTVEDLEEVIAGHERAGRFYSNSHAQNALAPVDLDPSLQRLAGSVARQSPEAGNEAKAFIYGRQTGRDPPGGPLPHAAGIETRPRLARPNPGDKPMGQFERVKDALKRALLIRDEDFHGHAHNAYATEKAILANAKEQARALYDDAYKAGGNVDLRPAIVPILDRWKQRAAEEPGPVGQAIRRAISLFESQSGPVHNIERFDKSKQFMDGIIDKLFNAPEGRNRYLGGVLTSFKNELLGAVDNISASELGAKYSAARGAFASDMEMVEALRLGREVFRDNSDVAADAFAGLTSPGQQKLFRLGMLDSFEQHMSRQGRTADVTKIFESPRIEGILATVIPRTETATGRVKMKGGAPAEFSDRPERFGGYLEGEKRMIETRDEVFGNSKTAQRTADDEAFEGLSSLVSAVRDKPSITALGMRMIENALNKFFGFRADTAASLGRRLFSAEPQARAEALAAIKARLEKDRFGHFTRLMKEYELRLTGAGAGQAGALGGL